jgi:adenine-specific DNA-methyltransferase
MARARREPTKVTRYEHNAPDPTTPETGHTALLPDEERIVTVPMDSGWVGALDVGKLESGETVVVDMDPAVDPTLLWAGKRNRRDVPVLPLQRNEIVSESRIRQIIERARSNVENGIHRQSSLFSDLEKEFRESSREKRVEFYEYDEAWRNKLICGDSLEVMESLATYEGLTGAVQMIFVDPPYGIGYDSNFQQRVDRTQNDLKDSADDVLTIKAFRDTWTLGTHSYLSYLTERLYLSRELLREDGSIFVQINDTNVHRVRQLVDEVFGADNFCSMIPFSKTSGFTPTLLSSVCDYLLWYAKDRARVKYFQLYEAREAIENPNERYICVETLEGEIIDLSVAQKKGLAPIPEGRLLRLRPTDSQGANESSQIPVKFGGREYLPPRGRHWSVDPVQLELLGERSGRLYGVGNSLVWKSYRDEFPYRPIANVWQDIRATGFGGGKHYVVETLLGVIERCVTMTTEPGDLVFDPTCGGGTSAYAAEGLGRRWITCDTSRVAINATRRRLLSGLFSHFVVDQSPTGWTLAYETAERVTLRTLAYELEPEKVPLVDRPLEDRGAVRVSGPFEVMTLGRYSLDDWKGYMVGGDGDQPEKLENYVEVICRLYRPHAEIGQSGGFVHAIAKNTAEEIGISVGPLTGRVTARQILDAASEAAEHGLDEVHVVGWAFEANVGEEKVSIEKRGIVRVQLVLIRPDALAEGLKVTQPDMLFSPLALPEVSADSAADGKTTVTLEGVGLFDRKTRTTAYHPAADGYIAAWYLDEDYDGDCFVDCQMFFDFKKAPNLKSAAGVDVDAGEFALTFTSEPFELGHYRRIAVKVVDVYGNESTLVREL